MVLPISVVRSIEQKIKSPAASLSPNKSDECMFAEPGSLKTEIFAGSRMGDGSIYGVLNGEALADLKSRIVRL
jgi:hypothetical protein